MKKKIEKQIESHSKAVDILAAIGKITHSIDAYDTTSEPEMYLNRLKRQRQILVKEYNKEIKPLWPFDVKEIQPLLLTDKIMDAHVRDHIAERLLNCIKHYLIVHCKKEHPRIGDILEIELDEFVLVRGVGMLTASDLERFKQNMKE